MDFNEEHFHTPDFALSVWNCQYSLVQYTLKGNKLRAEVLNFNLPEKWAEFVFETCGGAINISGEYRLPGMIWRWVLAKCRGEEDEARFIGEKIDDLLKKLNF
jgi:hypothetical protein